MAEKKKFEKPEMQVIKLNAKMHMLSGSGCGTDCGSHCDSFADGCPLVEQ